MRIEDAFAQPLPEELHPFADDPVLPALLERLLPTDSVVTISEDVKRFGDRLVSDIRPLGPLINEPILTQYDHWGNRIDRLQTSVGWDVLTDFSIREGIVALSYQRRHGEFSRIHAFTKNLLIAGDGHTIMCPFAMTDGAARVLELHGTPQMKRDYLTKLISFDPATSFKSGQWMTEKTGGSDVSRSETVASVIESTSSDPGPAFVLDGAKWFSSAAEGNMTVALARTESPTSAPGARGLSLFLVPLRTPEFPTPLSNGVRLHRLKNKLGTKPLPTAELELNGTRGFLIGTRARGVPTIAPVLNITRLYSAVGSAGQLRRGLSIATAFARVRAIDGGRTLLKDTPLHVALLAKAALVYRALVQLNFHLVLLLGRTECGTATPGEAARLRFLTPVAKSFNADRAAEQLSECMVALGGQGYMEETGIARLIRDQLVERVWEGTGAVLATDVLRAAGGSDEPLKHWIEWAQSVVNKSPDSFTEPLAKQAVGRLQQTITDLPTTFATTKQNPLVANRLLNILGHATAGLTLLEHAAWSIAKGRGDSAVDIDAFAQWILDEAPPSIEKHSSAEVAARVAANRALVFGPEMVTADSKL